MPIAPSNGIELCYETFGDPADPTVLLVMGLGAQMITWPEDFCHALVERGYHVVRFDNRDIGGSTWLHVPGFTPETAILGLLSGQKADVPYHLTDMAADAVGLLDHLGIESAHLVGASMGGMIVQTMAIEHPERVRSLTSIMSTTGESDVGQPDPEILGVLLTPRPTEREAAIESGVEVARAISCAEHFDPVLTRERVTAEVDRGVNPDGVARQLLAIVASPPRNEGLAALDVPALVVHGRQDRLVTFSGGERTAALIPGAELLAIDDMAHDVPEVHHRLITDAIAALAARADAARATV